jgi:hypothetical protein
MELRGAIIMTETMDDIRLEQIAVRDELIKALREQIRIQLEYITQLKKLIAEMQGAQE